MLIYNPFHPRYEGITEKNTGPSMAVPDQSLSVQEILSRYARGLPLGGSRVPEYEEEEIEGIPSTSDLAKMDLADRQSYFENAKDEVDKIKKEFSDKQNISAKRKKDVETTGDVSTSGNDGDGKGLGKDGDSSK